MSHLRDTCWSGDIWLAHSRRYGDPKQVLVPLEAAKATPRLMVPFDPLEWLDDRKAGMTDGLKRLAIAAKAGAIPGGSIENRFLKIDRLTGSGDGKFFAASRKGEAINHDIYILYFLHVYLHVITKLME